MDLSACFEWCCPLFFLIEHRNFSCVFCACTREQVWCVLSAIGSLVNHDGDCDKGPVSRKSRKLFAPEKAFVKFRPAYSVKLVFSYLVKGIKIKTNAKFCASRRLRFEDTKKIM